MFCYTLYMNATSRADLLEVEALLAGALKTLRQVVGPQHYNTLGVIKMLDTTREKLAKI